MKAVDPAHRRVSIHLTAVQTECDSYQRIEAGARIPPRWAQGEGRRQRSFQSVYRLGIGTMPFVRTQSSAGYMDNARYGVHEALAELSRRLGAL